MYQPPGPAPRKRHLVRNGLFGCLGVIVLIVVIAVAVAIGNSGGGSSGSTSTPAAGSAPAATKPARPVVQIGKPVRDGKFQFVVNSISQTKTVGDTSFGGGQTAQGEYQILHVTVANISGQPQTLDDSAQYVYDASGRKYNASSDADMQLAEQNSSSDVIFNNINPGNTVSGLIAFDMPAGDSAVKAELHDSPFSLGVTVNLSK